jgi:hypothetical protein
MSKSSSQSVISRSQAEIKPAGGKVSKLNPEWVLETKREFLDFLQSTRFPHPVRDGRRGSTFDYPEWLIMFIAVLSVKCHVKTYLGIHRLTLEYWHLITPEPDLAPISESQLRERLKKICHTPGKPAAFIFQIFPPKTLA